MFGMSSKYPSLISSALRCPFSKPNVFTFTAFLPKLTDKVNTVFVSFGVRDNSILEFDNKRWKNGCGYLGDHRALVSFMQNVPERKLWLIEAALTGI